MEYIPWVRTTYYICGIDHDKTIATIMRNFDHEVITYDAEKHGWRGVSNTKYTAVIRNFNDDIIPQEDFYALIDRSTQPIHTVQGPVFNPYIKIYIGCDKSMYELYGGDQSIRFSALLDDISIIH